MGRIAQVPLANQRRTVARSPQQRGQGRVLGRQAQRAAATTLAVDGFLGRAS